MSQTQDALEIFSEANNADELWQLLHSQLQKYQITSVFYGITHSVYADVAHQRIENIHLRYFKTSFDPSLFINGPQPYSIDYDLGVVHCIQNTTPRISSKDSIWLSEQERAQRMEIEKIAYEKQRWFKEDKRIGVTIPLRFGSYGVGGMGLQADASTVAEFDEVWRWGKDELMNIVQVFDHLARTKYDFFKIKLSPREKDIIFWLSEGCSAKVIADKLGKQPKSIQNRIAMMCKKLGVKNNVQLVSKVFVLELF